jgi:hypothetical protein
VFFVWFRRECGETRQKTPENPTCLSSYQYPYHQKELIVEIEILFEDSLREWARRIELQQGAVDELVQVANIIRADETLLALFTDFYHNTVIPRAWYKEYEPLPMNPVVQQKLDKQSSLFYLLAYLSGLPLAEKEYQQRGISMEIFQDTMLDIRIWLGQAYNIHGYWVFDQFKWIWLHLSCELFRLGRLQFRLTEFDGHITAFRCKKRGEILLLGDPAQPLRADGYALGAGINDYDQHTPPQEETQRAVFIDSNDGWTGNPITPLGYTIPKTVFLAKSEWDLVLKHGDTVLDLHIPRGERMGVDDCRHSLRQAFDFFAHHAPNRPFKASYCHTWFFTPQLQSIMLPESNIVRFQREFYLYPYRGDPGFLWNYVFGEKFPDRATAPRDTTLRRAVLDWLAQGGEFFDLPGLMFHGPEAWGSQPYMRWWESGGLSRLLEC